MARIGRRAKQRRTKELVLGSILFLIVAVVVVGLGVYYTSLPKAPNAETLCPADGPKGHYVLLVDKTDPLNFTQQQAFSIILKELVEKRVPEGFLFSVFILDEDFKQTARPLLELCNPGYGVGKSELTANLVKLRRQYEERFVSPLLQQTEKLVASVAAKESPILEMLQMVALNAFRRHDVEGERRLILMSDMLHNTAQFSMYKGITDFSTFFSTDYGRKSQSELGGVEVELHYLMNRPQLQTKRNLKFWEDYFDRAGARIVSVRPLEG